MYLDPERVATWPPPLLKLVATELGAAVICDIGHPKLLQHLSAVI